MEQAGAWHDFAAIVPVSAATGDGVDRLERVLLEQLPEGEPIFPDDYLTDQPERALAAEMVREKVLAHTRAELPFSTAVVVDQFDESERERMLRIYCTILVEHESQKPIVIGRGGEMIKRIGTEARAGSRALLRDEGVPGPPRQGQCRLARTTSGRSTSWACRNGPRSRDESAGRSGFWNFPARQLNTTVSASKQCSTVRSSATMPSACTTSFRTATLMGRVAAGDAEAFAQLFRRRQGQVYRFALHMTASPSIAEDVTQDVFLAVMSDAARYDAGRGRRSPPGSAASPGTTFAGAPSATGCSSR